MEKKHASSIKFKAFLKKNIYYIIMAVCLLAIAAMITVTVLTTQKAPVIDAPVIDTPTPDPDVPVVKPDPDPDVPIVKPVEEPVVMVCPVANPVIGLDYTVDSLVWHQTLAHYATNECIEYLGNDGDIVMAAYAGTVQSIEYDILNGYTVVIEHNSKLKTSYSSLNEPSLSVGQVVAKGEKIGTMGNTATKSCLSGPHVNFAVYENNNIVNPYQYLAQGDK